MNAADRETAERHLAVWEELRRRLPPVLPTRLLAHHDRAARSPRRRRAAAAVQRPHPPAGLLRPTGARNGTDGRTGRRAVRGLRARRERLPGRPRRGPIRWRARPAARTRPPLGATGAAGALPHRPRPAAPHI